MTYAIYATGGLSPTSPPFRCCFLRRRHYAVRDKIRGLRRMLFRFAMRFADAYAERYAYMLPLR